MFTCIPDFDMLQAILSEETTKLMVSPTTHLDDEVHKVLALASELADRGRHRCISGVLVFCAALRVNQSLATAASGEGITLEGLLRAIPGGDRAEGQGFTFCPTVSRALVSATGNLRSLLHSLIEEDPAVFEHVRQYSLKSLTYQDYRDLLNRIHEPNETVVPSTIIESTATPSSRIIPFTPE